MAARSSSANASSTVHTKCPSGTQSRTDGGIRNTCSRSPPMNLAPMPKGSRRDRTSRPFSRQPPRKGAFSAERSRASGRVPTNNPASRRDLADVPPREVDVAPTQRDELAAAQAGERGGEVDRGVLLGRSRAHERHGVLGGEDVDVGAMGLYRLLD